MTTKPRTSSERAFSNTVDAFMALSVVYLDCAEQLTQVTLATSRAGFEECVAASRQSAARGVTDPVGAPLALGQSLMKKALACARDGYECVTKAQLESARIMQEQLATSALHFPVADDWKGAVDVFSRAFRDFSEKAGSTFAEAGTFHAGKSQHLNKAA